MIATPPNLATDAEVRRIWKEELGPGHLTERVRDDRRARLHAKWLRHDRIWHADLGGEHGYHGRLATYLPVGRRVLENWVQKLKADLFPRSGRWFMAEPNSIANEPDVPTIEHLYTRFLHQMQLKRKTSAGLRQLVTLGTSPRALGWRTSERMIPRLQKAMSNGGPPAVSEMLVKATDYLGPTYRVVDLFLWYVWPYTVLDVKDATLVFEDLLLDHADILGLANTPVDAADPEAGMLFEDKKAITQLLADLDKEQAKSGRSAADKFEAEKERLARRGLRSRTDVMTDDPHRPVDACRGYWYGTVESDTDEEQDPETGAMGKVEAHPRWYQFVVLADELVVQWRRAPWWHLLPDYLATKFIERDNDFYGHSLCDVFDRLQYFTNDIMNQAGDALTWGMNPVVAIDPFAVQDPTSIRFRPAAKWMIRAPRESVTFLEPSKESAQVGFVAIQQLIALINDVANVAPFSGAGTGGARSRGRALNTATGMQIVLSENLIQVAEVIENIEGMELNPMLTMVHAMTQQCLDRDQWLRVAGAGGAQVEKKVTRADLIGTYDFQWLASASSHNTQVRSQQMLTMLQILARVPPQVFASQNKQVDYAYLVKQIWTVGFEQQDADRLLVDIQPVRSLDPESENQLIVMGRGDEVKVSPADQDQQHLQIHDQVMQDQSVPMDLKAQMFEHMRAHMAGMIAKQLMQAGIGPDGQPLQQPGQEATGDPNQPPQNANTQGGPVTSGRTVMPQAPGRTPSTTTDADVQRRQPRLGSDVAGTA